MNKMKKILLIAFFIFLTLPLLTMANPIPVGPNGPIEPGFSWNTPSIFEIILYGLIPVFLIGFLTEILVVYLYIKKVNLPIKILWSVILANLISFPIFVFALVYLTSYLAIDLDIFSLLIMLEIGVVIFEASIIYVFNKKFISYKSSLILSLLMNILSIATGFSVRSII